MPFDLPAEPIHTRCLALALAAGRGDGPNDSVDFRADILDLRKGGLMELGGRVTMAGIIHKMELSGSFSADDGALTRIRWAQSHVMHEPNPVSRGECCRDPMGRLEGLVGARLGTDFPLVLKQCFGGPLGCTHVQTLLQELNAFVARHFALRREAPVLGGARRPGERISARSLFFDALSGEEPAITDLGVRLADLHYAPVDDEGREVVARHDEVRLAARAELAGWKLQRVRANERCRRGPSCGAADWRDRTAELDGLVGRSLFGGVSRFCLERFAGREADALLLSALMCLAPGMTQVGAALSDELTPNASARPLGGGLSGPGPCYMLRAEGPLMDSIRTGRAPAD